MDGQDTGMREGIGDVIARHAAHTPDEPAILARGCAPLSCRARDARVQATRAHLNAHGIGRGDCVALIVSDRQLACTAYLAVTSSAVAVPMSAAATAFETESLLRQLKVDAVMVSDDLPEMAALARRLGIAVFAAAAIPDGAARRSRPRRCRKSSQRFPAWRRRCASRSRMRRLARRRGSRWSPPRGCRHRT